MFVSSIETKKQIFVVNIRDKIKKEREELNTDVGVYGFGFLLLKKLLVNMKVYFSKVKFLLSILFKE